MLPAALVLAGAGRPAPALEVLWTGSVSNDWSTVNNWFVPLLGNRVPGAGDDVTFATEPGGGADHVVDLRGSNRTVGSVTFDAGQGYTLQSAALILNDGTLTDDSPDTVTHTIDSKVLLNDVGSWNVNGHVVVNGQLGGAFRLHLNQLTAFGYDGTLTLAGDNALYEQDVFVHGGTLKVGVGNSVSNETTIRLQNPGASLVVEAVEVMGGLAGSGSVSLDATAIVGVNDLSLELSGDVSGSGDLIKRGVGTQTLSGNNGAHTGDIIVENGTLSVGANDSVSSETTVEVQAGALLEIFDPSVSGTVVEGIGGLSGEGALALQDSLRFGLNDRDAEFTGHIFRDGPLASDLFKAGLGTQTLIPASDHDGHRIVVEAGTLRYAYDGASLLTVETGATLEIIAATTAWSVEGDGALVLDAPLTITPGSGEAYSLTGDLSGSGELTKSGSGMLTLAGSNGLHTGDIVVTRGTLRVGIGNSVSSATTVDVRGAGTVIVEAGEGMGGLRGVGDLVLDAAVSVGHNDLNNMFSGDLSGGGDFTKVGSGTQVLSGDNQGHTGSIVVSGGVLQVGSGSNDPGSTPFDLHAGAELNVANAADRTLAGSFSGAGTLRKTGNAMLTLSGDNSQLTGEVLVDDGTLVIGENDSLSDISTVTVANGAQLQVAESERFGGLAGAGGVVLNVTAAIGANGLDTVFAGVIGGSGGLTKIGAGKLALSGANTYTGGTVVDGGTLALHHSAAASSGAVRVLGSVIEYGDGVDIANAVLLEHDVTFSVPSGAATQSGVVDDGPGVHGVTKTGTGALTLSAANTYGGGTVVDGGTLALHHSEAAGSGDIVVLGSTLEYGNGVDLANTVLLEHDVTLSVPGGAATQRGVIDDGPGSFGMTKTGTGTLTLAAANGFDGATVVSDGTLALGGDDRLVTTTALSVNGGTLALGTFDQSVGSATLTSGAITGTTGVLISASDYALEAGLVSAVLAGTVGLTKTGSGKVTLSAANTYGGDTVVDGGTLALHHSEAAGSGDIVVLGSTLEYGNGVDLANTVLLEHDVTLSVPGGAATQRGVIDDGPGSFGMTKTGKGTLTLAAANSFDGDTVVAGGRLSLSGGAALSDDARVHVLRGAKLSILEAERLGGIHGAGSLVLDADLRFGADDAGRTLSGAVSGTGNLVKEGNGTQALEGDNSEHEGDIVVLAGTLQAGRSNSVSSHTTVNVHAGATLQIVESEGLGGLAGDGHFLLDARLAFGTNNADRTLSGSIGGGGDLVKRGTGIQTITGDAASHTGEVVVDAGTLRLADPLGFGVAGVAVNEGAVLAGTGSLAGPIAVNAGGTLAPGASPGELSASSLTLAPTSTLDIEIGGLAPAAGHDVVTVAGSAALAGTLAVQLVDLGSGLFEPQAGDSFDVLFAETLTGVFGGLAGDAPAAGLFWNVGYLIDEFGTTDVVRLTATAVVPLPASAWLLGAAIIGLFCVECRRAGA